MTILCLDVGSSSVKAAVCRDGKPDGAMSRATYPTHHDGVNVEVDAEAILGAVAQAIHDVPSAKNVDAVGLSVMSPAWVAMDKTGRAITPVVTHQDRRSVEIARQLEARVGKERHLRLAGNRPFPGGISSTTCAWFLEHEPAVMKSADLVGHLNTLIHRHLTDQRVTDPSNASFMGLYLTVEQAGWSDEICAAVGISKAMLPEVVEADVIAGRVTPGAAERFGLRSGTPVMAGMVDTSAAMLFTGAAPGQLFHMCGSTDVLGLATDRPKPNEHLLTRALGIGRKWMSVFTLAAAGSAIDWMKAEFFRDVSDDDYHRLLGDLMKTAYQSTVRFEPYLAGERASIEQRQAVFSGLTLATTREEMLHAVIEALAAASAARLPRLAEGGTPMLPGVVVSGGGAALGQIMHRDWVGGWQFREVSEAGLKGLAGITPRER